MRKYLVRQLEHDLTKILNEHAQEMLDNIPVNEAPAFGDKTTLFMARAAVAVLCAAAEAQDSLRPSGLLD